jgi:hypothetical protein
MSSPSQLNLPDDLTWQEAREFVASMNYAYGVYDHKDNCWIGHATGPNLYRTIIHNGHAIPGRFLAMAAASLFCEILGRPFGAKLYDGRPVIYKDTLDPVMTAEKAMAMMGI